MNATERYSADQPTTADVSGLRSKVSHCTLTITEQAINKRTCTVYRQPQRRHFTQLKRHCLLMRIHELIRLNTHTHQSPPTLKSATKHKSIPRRARSAPRVTHRRAVRAALVPAHLAPLSPPQMTTYCRHEKQSVSAITAAHARAHDEIRKAVRRDGDVLIRVGDSWRGLISDPAADPYSLRIRRRSRTALT